MNVRASIVLILGAALAGCAKADFTWTKGEPAWFASSSLASRPFCDACGTPLGFTYADPAARMYVTIGSLDDPEAAKIERQYGAESRLSWVWTTVLIGAALAHLPARHVRAIGEV